MDLSSPNYSLGSASIAGLLIPVGLLLATYLTYKWFRTDLADHARVPVPALKHPLGTVGSPGWTKPIDW